MYSERVLTGDLAPPLAGVTMVGGRNQAPFVFGDYRPDNWVAALLCARLIPTRVIWMFAIGYGLIWLATTVGREAAPVNWEGLLPTIVAVVLAGVCMAIKQGIRTLDAYPVSRREVRALDTRAARYQVANPMFDAQARTHDLWRRGHIREAHAAIDRMAT